MSTLKVDGIRSNSATSDAITLASNGTCTANLTNKPNRNLIINGAMQCAQYGSSSTSSGYHTVDRFQLNYTGTNEAPTQAQVALTSSDTPYNSGFRFSYKVTNGNQTGGGGAAKFIRFKTTLEAQDIASSGWDYVSSSSFVTLSFWVKASVAQTYYGRLQTEDGTARNYPFSFALSANTWTKVTKTISGNTSPTLQFDNNNGAGLILEIVPYYGTDYTGSMSLDTWATYSNRTPNSTATWYEANDATFEITGVQLEVGSVATDFEHRLFGQELALCHRYYQQYTNIMSHGFVPDNGSRSYAHAFTFPVEMRSAPTLTISNTGSSGGQYVTDGNTNRNITTLNSATTNTKNVEWYPYLSGDLADFRGAYTMSLNSTSYQTTFKFSAEL